MTQTSKEGHSEPPQTKCRQVETANEWKSSSLPFFSSRNY